MAWVADFETRQCKRQSQDPDGRLAEEVLELREAVAGQLAQLERRLHDRFRDLGKEVDLLDRRQQELASNLIHSEALAREHSRGAEASLLGHLEAFHRDQRVELQEAVGRAVDAKFKAIGAEGVARSRELAKAAGEIADLAASLQGASEEQTRRLGRLEASQDELLKALAEMQERHQSAHQALSSATADGLGSLRAELQEHARCVDELARRTTEASRDPWLVQDSGDRSAGFAAGHGMRPRESSPQFGRSAPPHGATDTGARLQQQLSYPMSDNGDSVAGSPSVAPGQPGV